MYSIAPLPDSKGQATRRNALDCHLFLSEIFTLDFTKIWILDCLVDFADTSTFKKY